MSVPRTKKGVRLKPAPKRRLVTMPTVAPESFDIFLKAWFLVSCGSRRHRRFLEETRDALREASLDFKVTELHDPKPKGRDGKAHDEAAALAELFLRLASERDAADDEGEAN